MQTSGALLAILALVAFAAPPLAADEAGPAHVIVEAEAFDDYGGWVPDSQFMDQMGSPFLLAHGLGVPVNDAVTSVHVPAAGAYRVWVRTRDWVATWNAPGSPGEFQVLIDGKPLAARFGTEGADWHWQDGGTAQLPRGKVSVALHDLTGFEGRCDAILLAADPQFTPPNQGEAMAAFRRKLLGLPSTPDDGGTYDLVVVGGGMAGTCAALAAARLGVSVVLIQDRPVLGGNNSSEVRVWLGGDINRPPYPRVGDVVHELEQARKAHYGPTNTAELYEDQKKLALVEAEKNVAVRLGQHVNAVDVQAGRLHAVIAQDTKTGRRTRFIGRWFADCTGDGTVGFLAGADLEMTPRGHMGACNLWNAADTGKPSPFPRCPWALNLSDKPFPGRGQDDRGLLALGGWYWESGFDKDPIADREYVRDWNLRAMYGAWDALKNVDGKYPTHKLNWAAHISGPRESRRLLGDVVLSQADVTGGKQYPDGCVPATWLIDLHLPDPRYEKGFEGDAFISRALYTSYQRPYWIPYRSLYSRNVANLFMAGRDISATHEALGAVRVMRTGGMMGEVVGMAASLCKKHDADPRDVYAKHLDELKELLSRGVGKTPPAASALNPPPWIASAGANLARSAKVSVSSSRDAAKLPPSLVNDGQADVLDNDARWLSSDAPPHQVEFSWDSPQTISAARIVSGYCESGQRAGSPIEDFVLESFDGSEWKEIAGTRVAGNAQVDWHARFPPVETRRVRLVITAAPLGIARIWEVELYHPPGP